MNNEDFGKTMENVVKQSYIKACNNWSKNDSLVSQPNYHTTEKFSDNLLAIEMKRTVSDSWISQLYKPWYDYIKPTYGEKVKLCYMDAAL